MYYTDEKGILYYTGEKNICENVKKLLENEYKNIKVKIVYDDEHLIVTFIVKMSFKTDEGKFKHKQSISFKYEELEGIECFSLCELILSTVLYKLKEDLK